MTTPPPPPRPGNDGPRTGGSQQTGTGPQGPPNQVPRNSMTLPAPLAALPATVWRWIGGFVGAFVLVTVAITLLSFGALALSDVDGGTDGAPEEVSVLKLALLLTVYSWTGHIGTGINGDEDYNADGAITGPVPGAALLGLVALGLATRWLTRRFRPASRTAAWAQIAAAVAACLLVITVLGLIGRPSDDDGFFMSALAFGPVLRLGVLLTAAAVVGVALAIPRGQRVGSLAGDRAQRLVGRLMPSLDAALLHLAAWSVIGLVGGIFAAIVIRDDVPVGVSLLYLPSAISVGMAWAHLGGIGLSLEGSQDIVDFLPDELAHSSSWTVFSEQSPWVLWLLPLVALALIALIATRLTLLRAPGASVDLRHVAATAVSVAVLWFVVARMTASVSAAMDANALGEDFGANFTLGPTWWTYLLLLLVGVGIEVVHVFLGVRLVQSLPRGLVQRLVPKPHPGWGPYLGGAPVASPTQGEATTSAWGSTAQTAPPAQTAGAGEDPPTVVSVSPNPDEPTASTPAATATGTAWAAGPGGPAWGEARPVSGRTKVVIGLVAGAFVVLALGWFLVGQVGKRYFGPEDVALDYASAVVEGRASDAVEAGHVNVADRHRLLLDDDVYSSVKDRPEAAEVTDVKESDDGESATVTVEFEQGGERFTQELEAERSGRKMLLFPKWELKPVKLPSASLTVMSDEVKVGEQTLKVADNARPEDERLTPLGTDDGSTAPGYTMTLPALPGTYSFELPSTKFTESDPVEISIAPDQTGDDEDAYADEGSTLSARPGGDFTDEVNAQVKKKIDDCAASYDEATCPWDTAYGNSAEYSGRSFSPEEYPAVSVTEGESLGEGSAVGLDLDDMVTIKEKATCRTDVDFTCDKGESQDTTQYVEPNGWYATLKGDSLTVEWTDEGY